MDEGFTRSSAGRKAGKMTHWMVVMDVCDGIAYVCVGIGTKLRRTWASDDFVPAKISYGAPFPCEASDDLTTIYTPKAMACKLQIVD